MAIIEPTKPDSTIDLSRAKAALLAQLSSDGRHKYKRYAGLPLRYAGGKSLGVGHIIQALPTHINTLVAPFVGGASVEIACANELKLAVLGYDVFDVLAHYWQVQLGAAASLAAYLRQLEPTLAQYAQIKRRLKAHFEGKQRIEDAIELAAHYWFNHNLSYGPGFLGWMSKPYACPRRYVRLVDKVAAFRAPNLRIAQADFQDTIPAHAHDFLYCDPPYYLEGDSKMFKGIYPQRNFPIHHRNFDHRCLHKLLQNHSGGFLLSYNDCSTIRQWYADYHMVSVRWQYTMGQGETRIGANRVAANSTHVKSSHELLIMNYS